MLPPSHPSRERVLAELHARPFVPLPTEVRLLHFAFHVTEEEASHDRDAVERMAAAEGGRSGALNERYLLMDAGRLRWERHGEFVSYTFIVAHEAKAKWPDSLAAPGRLLVAIDLTLSAADPPVSGLVEADISDGGAYIVSDFLPNESGFVEIYVANRRLNAESAGAAVQRLLELETYRCFALLGLPVADEAAKTIGRIESELPRLIENMDAAKSLADNRELLDLLTALTVDLERTSAATHFRFGATRAYAELVRLRLDALGEKRLPDRPGLAAFFSRRFDPAVRYCATLSDREANLARKLTRAAQLLRTRVEIALQSQNGQLLRAMSDRARLQLRLQHTVEGLSVAAVAYYVAGLLHYVLEGAGKHWPSLDTATSLAAAVPVVVVITAFTVARIRRHHVDRIR